MRKLAFYIIGIALLGAPVAFASLPEAEVENLRSFYEGTDTYVPDAVSTALTHQGRSIFKQLSSIPNEIACPYFAKNIAKGTKKPILTDGPAIGRICTELKEERPELFGGL
jgi:hypothetical protein